MSHESHRGEILSLQIGEIKMSMMFLKTDSAKLCNKNKVYGSQSNYSRAA